MVVWQASEQGVCFGCRRLGLTKAASERVLGRANEADVTPTAALVSLDNPLNAVIDYCVIANGVDLSKFSHEAFQAFLAAAAGPTASR
jgi:hypothetical protein